MLLLSGTELRGFLEFLNASLTNPCLVCDGLNILAIPFIHLMCTLSQICLSRRTADDHSPRHRCSNTAGVFSVKCACTVVKARCAHTVGFQSLAVVLPHLAVNSTPNISVSQAFLLVFLRFVLTASINSLLLLLRSDWQGQLQGIWRTALLPPMFPARCQLAVTSGRECVLLSLFCCLA